LPFGFELYLLVGVRDLLNIAAPVKTRGQVSRAERLRCPAEKSEEAREAESAEPRVFKGLPCFEAQRSQ
jgi:hypothetical protein